MRHDLPQGGVSYADILELLPQAYPILMVDRVLNFSQSKEINARKCVSGLDPYFLGHFKDSNKVVPGLLVVEGIAQCAFLLAKLSGKNVNETTKESLLVSSEASFRSKIVPGDIIDFHVWFEQINDYTSSFSGTASVDGKISVKARCSSVTVRRE